MVILKLNGRKLSDLGSRWQEGRYVWISWLVPHTYAAISYTIVWGCGLGGFPNYEFMQHLVPVMALNASPLISTVLYLLLTGTYGMITRVSSDLGEEIGWRGFLIPELFKYIGYTRTSFLGGAV